MKEQEQDWLDRARGGEQEAFGLLVESYQRPVFALTYRMLGDVSEAEDAAQETFLRAYSRLQQYDPAHKFSTWLFSIANNHCIDRLRRRRVQFIGLDESPVVWRLESDSAQPERETLASEQVDETQALVNRLEPEYRTPVVLRYWNECSYQEIADVMDISVAAVKSRLFRARKKLASLYEEAQAAQGEEPAAADAAPAGPRLKKAERETDAAAAPRQAARQPSDALQGWPASGLGSELALPGSAVL